MTSTVAVIDYGSSNLRSVVNGLEAVADSEHRVIVSDDNNVILGADRIVFPGQGALGDCMTRLGASGLIDTIRECARTRPFFGICLGLQSLMQYSEENDGTQGLGLYGGRVLRFPQEPVQAGDGLLRKVPHMGWNEVQWRRPHPILEGIDNRTRFYFVHSYFVVPDDPNLTLGSTNYIEEFTAALSEGSVFATQFHPEKSAAAGLKLLENFLAWNGDV